MEHSYYTPPSSQPEEPSAANQARESLQAATSSFNQNIQEATGKLAAAAEQFGSMSQGLLDAVDEARSAAEKAQEAQRAAEETRQQISRDYGNLSGLMRELQEKISALAVLGRPFESTGNPLEESQSSEPDQQQQASGGHWQG